jgi:hypothetical protein
MAWQKWAGSMAGLVIAVAGPARAAPPLRVVVLVDDAVDEKVLVRIRGHASDLPVVFVAARGAAAAQASSQAEQLAGAEALAAREDADALIWFSYGHCGEGASNLGRPGASNLGRPPDWMIVHVGQPRTHSILTRSTGQQPCAAPSPGLPPATTPESAVLEGAAIVVRTALLALSEGGTIGVTPQPATATATIHPRLGISWMAAADGLSPLGQQGLHATVGFSGLTWGAEIAATATLPASATDESATVSLSRVAATMGAVVHQQLSTSWLFTGALNVGVAALARSTIPVPHQPPIIAEPPSRNFSLLVAPEGRFAWAIPGVRGLAAVFGLGADYLPATPIIGYRMEGMSESVNRRRPWPLQPKASIGVELRLQ